MLKNSVSGIVFEKDLGDKLGTFPRKNHKNS